MTFFNSLMHAPSMGVEMPLGTGLIIRHSVIDEGLKQCKGWEFRRRTLHRLAKLIVTNSFFSKKKIKHGFEICRLFAKGLWIIT